MDGETGLEAAGRGRPKRATNGVRRFKGVMVALEPAMVQQLDQAAAAEGVDSRSEIVRRACASYLRRAEKRLGTVLTDKGLGRPTSVITEEA